jgi:Mg2+/Co2+ transporter CorB
LNEIPSGLLFLIAAAQWALLLLLVSSEFNLLHIARSRLRQLAAAGNRSAHLADSLLRDPERVRRVTRIAETLLIAGIVAAASVGLVQWAPLPLVALGIAGLAVWLVITVQWLPRQLRSERQWTIVIAARCMGVLCALLGPTVTLFTMRRAAREDRHRDRNASALPPDPLDDYRALHERVADLDNITVDDIMIPRNDLACIDLEDDWDDILATLRSTPHTRLPLCENGIDNIIGVVHMKKVAHALARGELTPATLIEIARAREPYFAPEGTTLSDQLVNFKRDRRRVAFVVDEYGDIQGLVTLEDILEEIVGEFTTSPTMLGRDVHRESEDSYVVSGGASVRELNRALGWSLPVDGPRTLNGLIIEQLETIPQPGTGLRIGNLAIEILQTAENAVRSARVRPIRQAERETELSKGVA